MAMQKCKAELAINKNDLKDLQTGETRFNDPVERTENKQFLNEREKSNIRAKGQDKIFEERRKRAEVRGVIALSNEIIKERERQAKPVQDKMKIIEKQLVALDKENGRNYTEKYNFDLIIRYPKGEEQKKLADEYKALRGELYEIDSRRNELKIIEDIEETKKLEKVVSNIVGVPKKKETKTKTIQENLKEKENLKRFNSVKNKIIEETDHTTPFKNAIWDKEKITIVTTHEAWDDSNISKACTEHKEVTHRTDNKYLLNDKGEKILIIDNKGFYDMAYIEKAKKNLDKDTLTMYYKEDYPLVLKDKNLVVAIAPLNPYSEDMQDKSKISIINEDHKGIELSENRYLELQKETKEDLARKLDKSYAGGHKGRDHLKDQIIYDVLNNEDLEKKYT